MSRRRSRTGLLYRLQRLLGVGKKKPKAKRADSWSEKRRLKAEIRAERRKAKAIEAKVEQFVPVPVAPHTPDPIVIAPRNEVDDILRLTDDERKEFAPKPAGVDIGAISAIIEKDAATPVLPVESPAPVAEPTPVFIRPAPPDANPTTVRSVTKPESEPAAPPTPAEPPEPKTSALGRLWKRLNTPIGKAKAPAAQKPPRTPFFSRFWKKLNEPLELPEYAKFLDMPIGRGGLGRGLARSAIKEPVVKAPGFFQVLRERFGRSKQSAESVVQEPVVPSRVQPETASLDAMLAQTEAASEVVFTPSDIAPALPSADLLHPETAKAKPATNATVQPATAVPELTFLPNGPEKSPDDLARQKADEEAKKEQAERKAKKEEEDKRKAEEDLKQSAAVISKMIAQKRLKNGGIAELFASLRYLGMGKERLLTIQNLAMMLNAGLPLVDSIRTLQLEAKAKGMKMLLQRILMNVENGSPLWRAMQQEHFFSQHAIALIRIGEEAGNLAENMVYLAEQQEKDQGLRSKVKMAMIYPAIVLTLMFIVIMGLGMFVLPNLIQVLFSLNVPLPFVTRMVIVFSNFFSQHGVIAVPSVFGLFILAIVLIKLVGPVRSMTQWVLFRIPGIGRLLWEATIARFGVIVGGLLQAGVPLVDALRSLVEVTPIESYRRFYERMLEHILVGDSFARTFASIRGSEKLLPVSVQQLVMTGEKTGTLSKIMLKVADIYEKKANDTAQKLPVILEPILLLFIGALVGTIAFAIIVPIYSIVGNIGN